MQALKTQLSSASRMQFLGRQLLPTRTWPRVAGARRLALWRRQPAAATGCRRLPRRLQAEGQVMQRLRVRGCWWRCNARRRLRRAQLLAQLRSLA